MTEQHFALTWVRAADHLVQKPVPDRAKKQ
jgi:hypothetical protein